MYDLTKQEIENRMYNIHDNIVSTFTQHNDTSYKLFETISNFSSVLPDHLNKIVKLSDNITDALVVSGRTSLSKSILNMSTVSSTLRLNTDDGSLTLNYKDKSVHTINVSKSYLQTDNKYSIYNENKTILSSFDQFLLGNSINIETYDQYFSFTFSLVLEKISTISCIELKLNKATDSYPLISEIYYINENNKKVYTTILNSSETFYNLDDERQTDNVYNILLPNIKTKKIYITFEDKDKINLIIDSIKLKQLEYEDTGEIILGPVVSTSPILKASIEALGDLEYVNFFLSTDKNTWYELINPLEVSFDKNTNKILSFNTINNSSLKSSKDFQEIYLKISIQKILNKNKSEVYKTLSEEIVNSNVALKEDQEEVTVYESSNSIYYGGKLSVTDKDNTELLNPSFSYLESKGKYLINSFVESDYGLIKNGNTDKGITVNKPLKVGGEIFLAKNFNPYFSSLFGYTVLVGNFNVNTAKDLNYVLPLNSEYPKDTYILRQENKEIKIDISHGYLSSTLEGICIVEDKQVELFDSTYKKIKDLTVLKNESFNYISLVEDGVILKPDISDKKLNTLYPIRLNKEDEFGIFDEKIVCSSAIVSVNNIGKVVKDKLDFEIKLSKENGNSIYLLDTNTLDKYLNTTNEVIESYSNTTAIKLNNKNIKKGSIQLRLKND